MPEKVEPDILRGAGHVTVNNSRLEATLKALVCQLHVPHVLRPQNG
jgi:hypothetical protein